MIEKFKEAVDKGYEFGALLTDLSEASDCIDRNLLIAKLYLYGLSTFIGQFTFFLLEQSNPRNQN